MWRQRRQVTAGGGGRWPLLAGREGGAWAQEGTPAPLCAQEGVSERCLTRTVGAQRRGMGTQRGGQVLSRGGGTQSEKGGPLGGERALAQLCTTGPSSHGDLQEVPPSCSEDTVLKAPGNVPALRSLELLRGQSVPKGTGRPEECAPGGRPGLAGHEAGPDPGPHTRSPPSPLGSSCSHTCTAAHVLWGGGGACTH